MILNDVKKEKTPCAICIKWKREKKGKRNFCQNLLEKFENSLKFKQEFALYFVGFWSILAIKAAKLNLKSS